MEKELTNFDVAQIRPGFILLVAGTSIISKTIDFFTGCEFSHSGIMDFENDKLRVFESDFKKYKNGAGIICTDFDDYLNSDKGLLFLMPNFNYNEKDLKELLLDNVGQINYSFFDTCIAQPVMIICKRLFNKKVWIGSKENNYRAENCSAFVGNVFNRLKPDIEFFKEYKSLVPADYFNCPLLFSQVMFIKNRKIQYLQNFK
jgi:hypothetical protein